MNFSLTERALIFAKKILSTALKTNHAKNATFPSQIATNAMKMELPVLLVMLVGKFSLTERALIFATKILSTALKTNHAKNATFPSQTAMNAIKMAPPVPVVQTTLILSKGIVTLNAILMSTVKPPPPTIASLV
jgi:hypothetical protein